MSNNYDIKDINQAEGGRRRMDWAEREMPVLRSISERFEKGKTVKGHAHVGLFACDRGNRQPDARFLQEGGADVVLPHPIRCPRRMILPRCWSINLKFRPMPSKAKIM